MSVALRTLRLIAALIDRIETALVATLRTVTVTVTAATVMPAEARAAMTSPVEMIGAGIVVMIVRREAIAPAAIGVTTATVAPG